MHRKLSVALWLILAACGSAQYIQRTQAGGTIELDGDRTKAMEQANSMMAQHCGPNNFTIVQEGLEPIGTDTYTQQNTGEVDHTSRSGRTTTENQQTNGVQSTRTATAWRVHYQCGAPAAAGMPGQPPPAGYGPPPAPGPGDQQPPVPPMDPNAPPPAAPPGQ